MIVSFSRIFPWGAITDFVSKIKDGRKKHTFRSGFRWDLNYKIQFWDLSPRAHKANPKPRPFFISDKDIYPTSIQKYRFEYLVDGGSIYQVTLHIDQKHIVIRWNHYFESLSIIENNYNLPIHEIAKNDGFDSTSDFLKYFSPEDRKLNKSESNGQIIHWTNLKY